MLSDDIITGINKGIHTVGNVFGGAVRGGILFGILTFAAVSIAVALPAVIGVASIGAGIGAFLGALPAAAVGAGWAAAGTGALAGATLMAIASVLPGSKEGFGLRPKPPLTAIDHSSPSASDMVALRAQERAAYAATSANPYYRDGLGASLAARGSNTQDASLNK
jgi:hypothetical protein